MKFVNIVRRAKALLLSLVLTFSTALAVLVPGIAHAAGPFTCTWTGAGSDGNFSTAANWSGCNSTSPQAADNDVLIFDNAVQGANGVTDDVAALVVASITFQNNAGTGIQIVLAQNLTVNSAITQAVSDTTTTNGIGGSASNRTITLGGTFTVTSTAGLTIGDAGDSLALGGNTLTFAEGSSATKIVVVDAAITGAGAVVYNGPNTSFQLGADSTYSGTTHIIASSLPVVETGTNPNGFGTSSITVENAGSISFTSDVNRTISNPITVVGTTTGSPVTSLNFNTPSSSPITIVASAITLNGNTRFGNSVPVVANLTVNLAGTTANGHCVEYLGGGSTGNIAGPGFINGPAACIVAAAVSAPKAPDTGFAFIGNNPLLTLIVTVLTVGGIAGIARYTNKETVRSRR